MVKVNAADEMSAPIDFFTSNTTLFLACRVRQAPYEVSVRLTAS
jgi:hypothetical protein